MRLQTGKKLIEGHTLDSDLKTSADVVVVGTGSAGPVIALELARAGLDVVMLEEGGYHPSEEFTQLEHEMYPMLYAGRASQTTKDLSINVMQGRCLGGGTVVNMADCVRIHDEVLARWENEFGVTGLNNEALADSYERVEKNIGVNRVHEHQINRNNELLRAGATKLGYHGESFEHNRIDCEECGYCLIGCAYDCKRSTLVTYIPMALEAGARVYTDMKVTRVLNDGQKAGGVEGVIIDKKSWKPLRKFRVDAKFVVLAAGTIGSPSILSRTGIGNSSGQLGKNLSLQPQAPVMALFDETVRAWRGIPQSWCCDQFEQVSDKVGMRGFRFEGIMGGPAMAATIMPGFGDDHKKMMVKYPNCAAILLLVPDQPAGEVSFDDDFNPIIDYEFKPMYIEDLKKGLVEITKVYLAAGAQAVMMPTETPMYIKNESELGRIDQIEVEPNRLKFISAHPQGTCRMGGDKTKSVVDSRGFLHDLQQVMVCDASIFPTSVASHNMVPIMAVADYFVHNLLANREKYLK